MQISKGLGSLILVAVGLISGARAAAAGEAPAQSDQLVVVTATRMPVRAADTLVPVIVIERDAIERSLAVDVAELLRLHAGLDIGRSGGPGQAASLFIRGTNSDQAIVLVDGVRINPGTIGNAPLQDIAPELVDHVEIVKGPRSTLYGTDAIGGVINVITRSPDADRLQAVLGYGRYGTRQGFASGALAGDAGGVSAAVSWLESSGFPTVDNDGLDRGYRNVSVALAGRARFGEVAAGLRYWRAVGNVQYSDPYSFVGASTVHVPLDQDFVDSAFAIDGGGAVGEHWRTHLTLAHVVGDIRQNQADIYATQLANDFAVTHRDTLDWQNDLQLGPNALTVGAIVTREHASTFSYGSGFDVDTRANTWYAEDQLSRGPHRIAAAVGYTHHAVFGGHATWNAEYGYAPRPGMLLTAGAGTAFRAPNTTDLYGGGGNPALHPENARNLELGLRQRIGAHQSIALAAFDDRIDELVVFVPSSIPPAFGQLQNVDRARIRGLEARWEWRGERWRTEAEASRQDPRDLNTDATLLRRASKSATFAVTRLLDRGEVGLDLLAVGRRRDVDFNGGAVQDGGYLLANISTRVRLPHGLSLQARLDNAFDKRYELASGYNTARRGLYFAARYDLR